MIKVQIEYGTWSDITRTKIINAAHIETIKEDEIFQIYVLDVSGEEHRANSNEELLENVYVDGEVKYRRTTRKRI